MNSENKQAITAEEFDQKFSTGEDMTATQKQRLHVLKNALAEAKTEQAAYSDALSSSSSVPLGPGDTKHLPSFVHHNHSEQALRIHNEIDIHRFQEKSSINRHAHWEKTLLRTANAALEQSGAQPMIMHATEQENENPIVDEPLLIITPHAVFGTHGTEVWTQTQAFFHEAENNHFHTNINTRYGQRTERQTTPIPWDGQRARDTLIGNTAETRSSDQYHQTHAENSGPNKPLTPFRRSSTFTQRGSSRGLI